jgi:hypothetical protein
VIIMLFVSVLVIDFTTSSFCPAFWKALLKRLRSLKEEKEASVIVVFRSTSLLFFSWILASSFFFSLSASLAFAFSFKFTRI